MTIKIDTWENTEYSIKLENAIGNYLKNDIYDRKVFKFYQRIFSGLVGFFGVLFIQLLHTIIITVFGLEKVFHIVIYSVGWGFYLSSNIFESIQNIAF